MSETENLPDRKVAIPLGIGIFLMPYIFSWFTLRKGYSRTARAISLAWLSFLPALALGGTILEAVDPEGVKRRAEEAEQSRLADKAGQQQSEDPAELVMPNEAASELQGAPAIEEPSAHVVALPKLAFACGGDGYRKRRLVFDPELNKIYNGAVSQRGDGSGSKWDSSYIRKDGRNWYVLFKGNLNYPSREVYFDPSRLVLRENSNYEPGAKEESDACYARIEKVKRECATAGDIDKCMEIRDRTAWANEFSGFCSIKAPRWQDFQCDDLTDEYTSVLSQVRNFSAFNF